MVLCYFQIKKRKKDAEEPAKYMGCGDCDNLSRSITVSCYHGSFLDTRMIVFFPLVDIECSNFHMCLCNP